MRSTLLGAMSLIALLVCLLIILDPVSKAQTENDVWGADLTVQGPFPGDGIKV